MTASPIWHPFTQHGLGEPIPEVARAEGALLHLKDGGAVIDAISSWWVTTHGHCHPRIMAAIAEQAGKLDQIIFAGWTHEPAETLARGLRAMMPPELTRVFFSDSGSTSVEVALKMALGFWANRGEPRHRILVLAHSYHGDTIGAMSVGERGVFNAPYTPLLFDVGTIPFPAAGAEQATLDTLEAECRAGAAAFIVEPLILGAGGMAIYPPWVLTEMRAICERHRVLFIADEVMTAWGRTGTLLACEQAGVVPDILCLSKGLTGGAVPLAVTMAREEIYAGPPLDRPREDVLPLLQLHRQPDRLRRRQRQSRDLARRAGARTHLRAGCEARCPPRRDRDAPVRHRDATDRDHHRARCGRPEGRLPLGDRADPARAVP